MYDYHCHSQYSGDIAPGEGNSIDELCIAAKEKGITELCITDHYDIDGIYEGYFPLLDRKGIAADIAAAREKHKGLSILHGIELGQATHMPEQAEKDISDYNYDFIIGSVHAVRGIIDFACTDLKALSESERNALWEKYLSEMLDTVRWGKFNTLAHITYPCRYFNFAHISGFPDIKNHGREYFEPILKGIIERGIALECNTSGLRQGLGECMPNADIFAFYRELGGELVTVGSDAHYARDLGAGIREAVEMLKKLGFRYITRYKERVGYQTRIGEVL